MGWHRDRYRPLLGYVSLVCREVALYSAVFIAVSLAEYFSFPNPKCPKTICSVPIIGFNFSSWNLRFQVKNKKAVLSQRNGAVPRYGIVYVTSNTLSLDVTCMVYPMKAHNIMQYKRYRRTDDLQCTIKHNQYHNSTEHRTVITRSQAVAIG